MKTPPLIIGAALLLWGFEAGHLILAVPMAVSVEASRLIKQRWDFSEADFKRVSILCSSALVGIALFRFATGWFEYPAWMIFKWMPVILLPLFLAQIYSTRGRLNMSVLFLFHKKQIATGQSKPRYVDLAHVYLASCLFAAGFANNRNALFYVGMLALGGWVLWSRRSRRWSLLAWVVILLAAAGAGYLGQIGLSRLQTLVEHKVTFSFLKSEEKPYQRHTQIGEIRDEKLSNRIEFRARAGGADEHSLLLREVTYDTYRSKLSIWSTSRKGFSQLQQGPEPSSWSLARTADDARTCTIAQKLEGNNAILKMPGGAFQLDDLEVETAEKNDFGAVKVQGKGLKTYHTRYGLKSTLISPPGKADLKIPDRDSRVIKDIAAELKLASLPPPEILEKVKTFFTSEFTYSLKQKSRQKKSTMMEHFLSDTRSGHCELFATATVLLLRQAGIPSRYARGYAVNLSDSLDGWSLVRARYAHAWVIAHVDGDWVSLDTTPGNWPLIERESESIWERYWQKIKDYMSAGLFRFAQLRHQMQSTGYLRHLWVLLLAPVLWIGWRVASKLMKRHQTNRSEAPRGQYSVVKRGGDSDFYKVEAHLNSLGFKRFPWETFSAWLNRIEHSAAQSVSLDIPRQSLQFHYRYRFDPLGLSPSEKSRMTAMISAWLAEYTHESLSRKSSKKS